MKTTMWQQCVRTTGNVLASAPRLESRQLLLCRWILLLSLLLFAAASNDLIGNKNRNESSLNVTELDCHMRSFALQYARHVQPWRHSDDTVFRHMEDALQVTLLCPERRLDDDTIKITKEPHTTRKRSSVPLCRTRRCIFVDSSNKKIHLEALNVMVVPNITAALQVSREQWKDPYHTTIIFRTGIHYVGSTSLEQKHQPLKLHFDDSGLSLTGEPDTWLSGAIALPSDDNFWNATSNYPQNDSIRVANLTELFEEFGIVKIPKIISLFGTMQRYVRARYPNSNPEVDQWGYNSPHRLVFSLPANQVFEWHKPPPNGIVPTFTYIDLRINSDDRNRPIKNDSTMEMYNVYGAGIGGVCSTLWGNESSYWCSNSSAGGWAEVDQESAVLGRLQIPVGMTYNQSNEIGQRLQRWNHSAVGGIIHAWHSQSWAMHMFEIQSSKPGVFIFNDGGGRQGGRNWCRCDQCSYAAPWCGQRQNPPNHSDNRLISGTWYVENVLAELDIPGEFFFDRDTNLLYLYPNQSEIDASINSMKTVHSGLRFSILDQIIRLTGGVSHITISNLGFRDTSATYLSNWSIPSGGDWSIHRGGAIFMEDVANITIRDCVFSRLDGNAIFLSRRTRNVTIRRNLFEWIGESAIALWGNSEGFNATAREFPLYTLIDGNVMRELGIYQKQSSSIFISKAALTTIRNNVMFNIARAAINFNDMVGGGDKVEHNVIFNTCRESGDHGPINSWDRQPFLTDLLDGITPSFNPIRRSISFNLIFANYGANQGVDNDDGSSWYHIYRNVMYSSNGFKMDYGGHDSIFEENLVLGYPRKGVCVGFGSFFEGRGHIVRRNICLAANNNEPIIQLETCKDNHAHLHDNKYFSPSGKTLCRCGYEDPPIPFEEFQAIYGIEERSTVEIAPDDANDIMGWAFTVLFSKGTSRLEKFKESRKIDVESKIQ
jgi:Right handed beta helix region